MDQGTIIKQNKTTAWLMFAMGIVLVVGWPIAAFVNWENIVHSDARLGYLIADVGFVAPLCFISWVALKNKKSWGPLVFALTAGALLYDAVHFGIFLIQVKFLGISPYVYILLILVIVVIIYFLFMQQVKHETT